MKDKNKPVMKAKEAAKEAESKHTKFKRVCTPRLRKALKAIALIGNCSTKDYAYSKEQADKIYELLDDAVQKVIHQFSGTATEASAVEL